MPEKITRFSVSLENTLCQRFNRLIRRRHYTNRSEAVRDLIRRELVSEEWKTSKTEVVGVVTLVYDHHVRGLSERLISIQHAHPGNIIAAMHVHLDHHNCLEVLIVHGSGTSIEDLADRLRSVKGVKYAALSTATTGSDLE